MLRSTRRPASHERSLTARRLRLTFRLGGATSSATGLSAAPGEQAVTSVRGLRLRDMSSVRDRWPSECYECSQDKIGCLHPNRAMRTAGRSSGPLCGVMAKEARCSAAFESGTGGGGGAVGGFQRLDTFRTQTGRAGSPRLTAASVRGSVAGAPSQHSRWSCSAMPGEGRCRVEESSSPAISIASAMPGPHHVRKPASACIVPGA